MIKNIKYITSKTNFKCGYIFDPIQQFNLGKWENEYRKIVENASDDYCLNMDQVSLNKVLYNNLDLVNFLL